MNRKRPLRVILLGTLLFCASTAFGGSYLPFLPTKDELGAVLISPLIAPSDPFLDPQLLPLLASKLNGIGVPVLIAATDDDFATFRESALRAGAVPSLMRQAPLPWLSETFSRDYGPIFLHQGSSEDWAFVSVERDDYGIDGTGDLRISQWFADKAGLPWLAHSPGDLDKAGGNLMVDGSRRCFSGWRSHPLYGRWVDCQNVTVIPCHSRVCHSDEYVTFLKDDTVATALHELVDPLNRLGFKHVVSLPEIEDDLPSFANILVAHDSVFFSYTDDVAEQMKQAKRTYEQLGYRVFALHTSVFSGGGIHCMTKEIPLSVWKRL